MVLEQLRVVELAVEDAELDVARAAELVVDTCAPDSPQTSLGRVEETRAQWDGAAGHALQRVQWSAGGEWRDE